MARKSKFIPPKVTVTPKAGAYTANDVVGGLKTVSLSGESASILGGILNQITIADSSDQGAALTLWLFRDKPTVINDDAAFAPVIADLDKCFAVISVSTYTSVNSLKYAAAENLNKAVQGDPDGNNFYMYVVADATPTFTSNPLYFTFDILTE